MNVKLIAILLIFTVFLTCKQKDVYERYTQCELSSALLRITSKPKPGSFDEVKKLPDRGANIRLVLLMKKAKVALHDYLIYVAC